MAQVVGHLGLEELQAGYRGSGDATLARHYQVIWLLAQGRTCAEVAGLTSFAPRWVEQLLARYNAFGPRSLGDRRRGNGAAPTVLTPAMLAAVRERVRRPPDDGGVWTARKVAAFMAADVAPASTYDRSLVRLAFLAPELQRAILTGRQPPGLTLRALMDAPIPLLWTEQAGLFDTAIRGRAAIAARHPSPCSAQ